MTFDDFEARVRAAFPGAKSLDFGNRNHPVRWFVDVAFDDAATINVECIYYPGEEDGDRERWSVDFGIPHFPTIDGVVKAYAEFLQRRCDRAAEQLQGFRRAIGGAA